MKARFGRGSETRLRIIRTAADLFHKQGARATSPDDIIEASRTAKGQFYHYFKSKEGLVHEVLQNYLSEIKAGSAPLNYEIRSWKDLENWFAAQVELQKNYEMTRGIRDEAGFDVSCGSNLLGKRKPLDVLRSLDERRNDGF